MNYTHHINLFQKDFEKLPTKEDLQHIIDLVASHDRVIFCTMGKSAFACRKVVYTARSFGLNWHDLDVCHAFHGDAGIIKEGDLLVLVSKSGQTEETVRVAKYFSKWTKVSITSNKESDLDAACEQAVTIPVQNEGSPFGLSPMISTTLYMLSLYGILSEVIHKKGLSVNDFARNHPGGSIGKILKEMETK